MPIFPNSIKDSILRLRLTILHEFNIGNTSDPWPERSRRRSNDLAHRAQNLHGSTPLAIKISHI